MGFFGSKKIYVSSSLQNLAGEEIDRPNYLKTTVFGGILGNNTKTSIADTIQNSYLKGPGIGLRNFFRWADNRFDPLIGMPTATLGWAADVDPLVLKEEIPHAVGEEVVIQHSEVGLADYSWWAEQWMLENEPNEIDTDWSADINNLTNEITITFEDLSTTSFAPTDFDRDETYIYAGYVTTDEQTTKIFIYRIGSGNTDLDELINTGDGGSEFFPFLPLRLDNEFVSVSNPDVFDLSKRGFKKAVGGKLSKIEDEIAEAENLDDMDYIYVVFGVSLNVIENSCRKYIYEFFHNLMGQSGTNEEDYTAFQGRHADYQASLPDFEEWLAAQDDPLDPLYGTPAPGVEALGPMPKSSIRIKANGDVPTGFDMEISWVSIEEVTGAGLGKPEAVKGEVWFDVQGTDTFSTNIYRNGDPITTSDRVVDRARLYWQIESDSWKRLDLVGFVHKNYIYKGKYVEITMKEALEDEEESGFLVPLHLPTLKELSLIDSTQMSTACVFLVYNSYVIKKTGLLGSLFFKVFLVAVIVAVVVFAPQLAPGLVQAAASTGSALGLTGTAALVAGAAVNAIAAMIVTKLVMKGLVAVFGPQLAAIIGAVLAIASIAAGAGLFDGRSLSLVWGDLMSAQNLIALTSAVGQGVAGYLQGSLAEIAEKSEELQQAYEKQKAELDQLMWDTLGGDRGVVDPLSLTDVFNSFFEPEERFLTRTLMTGSDIAELSLDMLHNFAEYTLKLQLKL